MHKVLAGLLLTLSACGFQVQGGTAGDAGDDGDDQPTDGPVPDDIGPDAPSSCLDGVYCRRRKISVPPAMVVGGPHTSFPLLVHILGDSDLSARARNDGRDIVFTSADGVTRLPYERQTYVGSTGELMAWVTVPQLTSSTTTELYLWYGNPDATDQQSDTAWPEPYKGVFHFDTNAADSSRFGNVGTATAAFGGTGKLRGAAIFDQTTDVISLSNSAALDAVAPAGTIEIWANFQSATTTRYQLLLSTEETFPQGSTSDGYSFSVEPDSDLYFFPKVTGTNFTVAAAPWTTGWQYAVVTFELSTKNVELYVNGTHLTPSSDGPATMWTTAANVSTWFIGGNPESSANYFAGLLDEIRISATVRSAAWITTTYRNISTPTTFIVVGDLETFP